VPLEGDGGAGLLARYVEVLSQKVPKLAPALRGEAEPQKSIKGGAVEKAALRLAQDVARIDEELVARALELARDFAVEFRRDFLAAGWISFDGILLLVLELLRSEAFPGVREILRARYRAVLVDEFQDTDPVQGEIIRLICEDGKGGLERGKLFLVGDPKQSIYGFRGADIIAYQGLVAKILGQGGERVVLRTNFRSHGRILDFVNGVFGRVIQENGDLQPHYEPIEPAEDAAEEHDAPPIQVIRVENAKAGESREVEAREVADWIRRRPEGVRYKDVAILLRSLMDVGLYLDELRAAGIPYVVEGEKYFYGTTEVVDFINVLRAVSNPHDRVAVAGVLRSPYGAVPDAELYARRQELDYRVASPWPVFGRLKAWNSLAGRVGVGELLDRILEESHALEIAQAGHHGEQAVANLLKLRAKAGELEAKGGCTLREFLDSSRRAVRELEEEGESPLADETLDAVRVMSIHKSKGLEFPVVILPDLHRTRAARREKVVDYDWTTGTLGVRVGEVVNAGGAALSHLGREREREEWRRVLYVACTRPEQILVLLGSADAPEESFLGLLEPDLGDGAVASKSVPYARPEPRSAPKAGEPGPVDWGAFVKAWSEREERAAPPAWLTSPTRLQAHDKATALEFPEGARRSSRGVEIGIACHQVLQRLDFSRPGLPVGTDEEAAEILRAFFKSAAFKELAGAEILARELPFVVPWEGRAVQGVIDVVYRAGGKLVVADYKTDTIVKPEAHAGTARIYAEAVRRALGEVPASRLVYLRHGRIVAV
jgi:ATP-dependent helicase/nuclease subunit A